MPPTGAISHWRRFAIRLLAVCVIGLLVGAGWLVLKPQLARQLTSYGEPVSNASQLLRQVERSMDREVRARHGARGRGARCYYSTDTPAGRGDLPTAITDRMYCGPVLFVDGDPSRPYLTYNLLATPIAGGRMQLAVDGAASNPDSPDPRPVNQLVRPDGKLPPKHGRFATPAPPAAVGDVLTTTSTLRSQLTSAPPNAQMTGQLSGVRLVEYGFVSSYDWGDRARTVPAGYRLLAFATNPEPGEVGDQAPDLSVRVDGLERGPLQSTSDYIVTAVPLHARSVDLVLTDSGVKQSLSLLTGRPDGGNPAVTMRSHTSQQLGQSKPVKVRLKTAAGTGTLEGTLSVKAVTLTYWAADGTRCPQPDKAWLHIAATVELEGDKHAYGAESALLTVSLPGSSPLAAQNAAGDPATQVDDVVQVPASVTTGSLTYSGTVRTSKGTITVLTPVTVPFHIPAG